MRQVGDRLAKAMDGRGSAARIGGDEFAIICDAIGARDEAVALGEKIQSIFATPFAIPPLNIRLTSACGLALFPRPAPSRTTSCARQTPRSTGQRRSGTAAL